MKPMTDKKEIRITHVDELDEAARILLNHYPESRVFAFYGPMGAGKTTFIKALCRHLEVSDLVSSPSFPIVNHYESDHGEDVYHFDFYRINSQEEVYDLGYEDYFYSGSYCFIEWPEKVEALLPPGIVCVYIELVGQERTVRFQ